MNTKPYGMFVPAVCGIALVAMLLTSTTALAQRSARSSSNLRGIELSGFYGWQYGGDFTAYQGEIEIDDSDNFGFILGVPIPSRPEAMVELSYTRQNTAVNLNTYPQGIHNNLFDVAVEYYQIGAMYNRRAGKASPFGGLTLGAVRFAPQQNQYAGFDLNDEWRFAISLGLGVKAYMSERIGLRFQGRLLMPFNFYGTSFWFGTGGSGVGVNGGSAIIQGDVSGGLFVLF